jgi:hypothetical protein
VILSISKATMLEQLTQRTTSLKLNITRMNASKQYLSPSFSQGTGELSAQSRK